MPGGAPVRLIEVLDPVRYTDEPMQGYQCCSLVFFHHCATMGRHLSVEAIIRWLYQQPRIRHGSLAVGGLAIYYETIPNPQLTDFGSLPCSGPITIFVRDAGLVCWVIII